LTTIYTTSIRSIQESLESLDKRLDTRITALDDRLMALDRKFDQLNFSSERNSVVLSQMGNQLTQLLAALGAVATLTPLFQVLHAMPRHQDSDPTIEISQATSFAQTLVSTQIPEDIDARRSATKRPAGLISIDEDNNETFTGNVKKRSKYFRDDGDRDSVPNLIHIEAIPDSGVIEPTIVSRGGEEIPSSDLTIVPFSSFPIENKGGIGATKRKGGVRKDKAAQQSSLPQGKVSSRNVKRTGGAVIDKDKTANGTATRGRTIRNAKKGTASEAVKRKTRADTCSSEINTAIRDAGDGADGQMKPQPEMEEFLARKQGPVQRHGVAGVEQGSDRFHRLATEEEENVEDEESLDMSFIWGSLPDEDSSSSF